MKTVAYLLSLLLPLAAVAQQPLPPEAKEKKVAWYMEVDRLSSEDTLAITTMQGLANREHPQLLLFTGEKNWTASFKRKRINHAPEVLQRYRNCDDVWKEYLEQKHGFTFETLRDADELCERLKGKVQGLVVYKENEPFQYVLAVALASAYDLVAVTETVMNRYPLLGSLPVKEDLRKQQRPLLEAHKEIWARCKDRVTKDSIYSVGAESHILGIDMAVAKRMFVYRLSSDTKKAPEESAFITEMLASLKPMSPVWGWGEPSESILRDLATRAGMFVMCSTSPNTSFLHQLKPLRTNPFERATPLPDYSKSKPKQKYYISCIVNEGDSIKIHSTFMAYGMWLQPQRGKIPINWGVCPHLYEEFPGMMEYYYLTASANDSFSATASGYGYFTQSLSPYLKEFAEKEIRVNRLAGITTGMGWGCDELDKKPRARDGALVAHLEKVDPYVSGSHAKRDAWYDSRKLEGYINETGKYSSLQFTPEGRPVINLDWKMFYWWHRFGKDLPEEELYRRTVEQIEKITSEHQPPYFIPIYGGTPEWFEKIRAGLDPEKYEFVLLEEMMALAKQTPH